MSEYAVELREVVKRFGETVVAVNGISLRIREGEFFSLLGPSGCGKTTTLRLIAGFEMPTSGSVRIYGEEQGYLPPYQRPVNTVFQNYALFPHMTVAQNVAFGLEMKKVPKDEIKRRVAEALELVRLTGKENRRPKQLSGGQKQRVALARALVNRPKVLLLDEPLGALDLKLRKAMQSELKALQEQVGITFIYVTHDQEEALVMSDRIAVMNEGNVLQVGTPEEIYEHPQSRFVADFIGKTNFIPAEVVALGQARAVQVKLRDGTVVEGSAPHALEVSQGDQVVLSIRPEKLYITPVGERPQVRNAEALSQVDARLVKMFYVGSERRYVVKLADETEVVVQVQNVDRSARRCRVGDQVSLHWRGQHARLLKE
ncbi:MAG TPA: ABC transporter ATP-binding protein [Chloroflexi bacterium]|nr:ABC transporter ATP-binding protein [Chloroflexota bacterium]